MDRSRFKRVRSPDSPETSSSSGASRGRESRPGRTRSMLRAMTRLWWGAWMQRAPGLRLWPVLLVAAIGILVTRPVHRPALSPVRRITPPAHPHELNWIDPKGIVIHNSDTPARLEDGPVTAKLLNRMHHDDHPDWITVFEGHTYYIGYHYVILPNGVIQKGRPDHCVGCHAKKHNDWLGICLVGAFQSDHTHWWPERPTAAQLRSLVALCERLMDEYHIPLDRVKRHRDVQPGKLCPGVRFPYGAVMAELGRYVDAERRRERTGGLQLASHPGFRTGSGA